MKKKLMLVLTSSLFFLTPLMMANSPAPSPSIDLEKIANNSKDINKLSLTKKNINSKIYENKPIVSIEFEIANNDSCLLSQVNYSFDLQIFGKDIDNKEQVTFSSQTNCVALINVLPSSKETFLYSPDINKDLYSGLILSSLTYQVSNLQLIDYDGYALNSDSIYSTENNEITVNSYSLQSYSKYEDETFSRYALNVNLTNNTSKNLYIVDSHIQVDSLTYSASGYGYNRIISSNSNSTISLLIKTNDSIDFNSQVVSFTFKAVPGKYVQYSYKGIGSLVLFIVLLVGIILISVSIIGSAIVGLVFMIKALKKKKA